MNGEVEGFGDGSAAEQLHRLARGEQTALLEGGAVIGACIEKRFQPVDIQCFVLTAVGVAESAQFGLPADHGDLSAFESEAASFACAGVLTLGSAARGGPASGTAAARDALALMRGARMWS